MQLAPGAVVALDLDGVMWRGRTEIPGAGAAVAALRAAGHRVVFVTNNSARTVREIVEQLRGCGVPADDDDVVGSAAAAARLLARDLAGGARVLVAGGAGVVEALEDAGFEVVRDGDADAVVAGWHRDFDFDRLAVAMRAIRNGARFVATNTDATFPTEDGLLPGGGAIVAAIATAGGAQPEVAGKPHPPIVDLLRDRFGANGVMVGDRLDTDGVLAERLGWPFALVLSGVTGAPPAPDCATVVARDLAALVDDWLQANHPDVGTQ